MSTTIRAVEPPLDKTFLRVEKKRDFREKAFPTTLRNLKGKHHSLVKFITNGSFRNPLHRIVSGVLLHEDDLKKFQEYAQFYTPRRGSLDKKNFYSRGFSFYSAADAKHVGSFTEISAKGKLMIIEKDIHDSLQVLREKKLSGLNDNTEYKLWIGVADYLKNHTLVLFNALTFIERGGTFSGDGDDGRYKKTRQTAQKVLFATVKMYYRALLGREDDSFSLDEYEKDIQEVLVYLNDVETGNKGLIKRDNFHQNFKQTEIDNPITILKFAYNLALNSKRKKPENKPKITILLASGGIEGGIVAYLVEEILEIKDNQHQYVILPYSVKSEHANQDTIPNEKAIQDFLILHDIDIAGKNVRLIDDNTITGTTILRMLDALKNIPKKIEVCIVEMGIEKMREELKDKLNKKILNFFKYTVGFLPFETIDDKSNLVKSRTIKRQKIMMDGFDPYVAEMLKQRIANNFLQFMAQISYPYEALSDKEKFISHQP